MFVTITQGALLGLFPDQSSSFTTMSYKEQLGKGRK
jgi:hypothetical protein